MDDHFKQLTAKLRILGLAPLQEQQNIVNLLGACTDDPNYQLESSGLVLEYSDLGSMRSHFRRQSEANNPLITEGADVSETFQAGGNNGNSRQPCVKMFPWMYHGV